MEKIYEQAKDVHVRGTYVYGKSNSSYAYTDSDCTTKFTTSELQEVFQKGAVIAVGDAFYQPVSFAIKNNVGTVTYVKADTTTPTTAVLAVLNAVQDPA